MKKSKQTIEKEFYSYRRYCINKYNDHKIKALYWLLKYKYYKNLNEK